MANGNLFIVGGKIVLHNGKIVLDNGVRKQRIPLDDDIEDWYFSLIIESDRQRVIGNWTENGESHSETTLGDSVSYRKFKNQSINVVSGSLSASTNITYDYYDDHLEVLTASCSISGIKIVGIKKLSLVSGGVYAEFVVTAEITHTSSFTQTARPGRQFDNQEMSSSDTAHVVQIVPMTILTGAAEQTKTLEISNPFSGAWNENMPDALLSISSRDVSR